MFVDISSMDNTGQVSIDWDNGPYAEDGFESASYWLFVFTHSRAGDPFLLEWVNKDYCKIEKVKYDK